MKKATLLACVCALAMSSSLAAQESAQVVTYVEDASQGVLLNRFQDNWFITAEGGAGVMFRHYGIHRKLSDRFAPAASFYVGKWFSPVAGLRLGANWSTIKQQASGPNFMGVVPGANTVEGFYKQKFNQFGGSADFMLNLTNWWCGYKPGRVYNAILYAGLGADATYAKKYDEADNNELKWKNIHNTMFEGRAGLINSFNLSKQVALALDLRWTGIDELDNGKGGLAHNVQAFLSLTYKFKNREWNAPIVPICPEPENCDALRARLAAADARIADLEAQLRDCLNRPVQTIVEKSDAPLATIYYPIGVSRLTKEDKNVLQAIAYVMKDNPSAKYTLTGWADNYTGSEQVNIRLRHARANGVQKELVKNGVPESQLNVTINNGSLCDLGEKFVSLDRAVTIEENK